MSSPILRDTQSLVLSSGRILAFAEYGKPNGYPVVYLHGFPMCRLEGSAFDKPARRANIRIIAPDRPGMGHSSFVGQRKILDVAGEVKALAAHLGVQRFAVLGVSGGTPYALACAKALPREMLTGVGVLSGMGSFDQGTMQVPFASRVTGWLARNCPTALKVVTDVVVAGLRRLVSWSWVEKKLDKILEEVKKKEDKSIVGSDEVEGSSEIWTPAESRKKLLRALFEPFAQGSAGAIQDAALVSQDWGFEIEKVTYPIKIWHGAKDVNAPIQWIRSMAKRLPNGKLYEYEEETHGSMVKHSGAVFRSLLEDRAAHEKKSR